MISCGKKNLKGFSLAEILIVLAIIAIVSVIAVSAFRGMNESQILDKSRLSIMSIINETRSSSMSSKDSSDHGVYIAEDKITTFVGQTYNPSDARNREYYLNSRVRVSSPVPTVVIFRRTSGVLSSGGQIVINISLRNNQNSSSSLTIFPTGLIQKDAQ